MQQSQVLRGRALGYLDQTSPLLPDLNALENAMLPALRLKRAIRKSYFQDAVHTLEELGLGDRLSNLPSTLSGGERQRVALARSVLLAPPLLVIDEPTASLDRSTAEKAIALIRQCAQDGAAVLVSTHDPLLIAAADDVTDLL